ncbi:hypothetical protein VE03_09656 [Pseudogymnoascus sp. 23342-1-I1]|nr:hypothetical protein VE03_09656 [Pseudogymnoascus sp. 23342-1-I1]
MKASYAVSLGLCAIQAANSESITDSPEVSVSGRGTLVGNRSEYINSVYNFKNIPYGGAPTGEYRWKHPQHPSWNGTRDATVFGLPCPQIAVSEYSEDCLTLNIWAPDNVTLNDVEDSTTAGLVGVVPTLSNSKLPVYVFFPGGGAGSLPAYDGAGLAAKGVIVITTNYRLGALGFLAHPELSANSSSGTSGNYGLVDQQASLHWINENIASFGGDRDRITIGGQSAGASSVLHHINSPLATGLFNQVIAESGPNWPSDPMLRGDSQSYRGEADAEAHGVEYFKTLNISTIAEARQLPVSDFLAADDMAEAVYATTVFADLVGNLYHEPLLFRPVLDGYVLPASYMTQLQEGNHSIVPVLTGNNRDEDGVVPAPGFSVTNYTSINTQIFGSVNLTNEFFKLYAAGNSSASADLSSNAFYRDQRRVGTHLWANAYSAGCAKNTSGNGTYNVYTYTWTHAPPGEDRGAYHGSEIPYAFSNLYATDAAWTEEDYEIADRLSDYWVNFISNGNPNGNGLPNWPANSASSATTFQVGDGWGVEPVADEARFAFIKGWFSKWQAY